MSADTARAPVVLGGGVHPFGRHAGGPWRDWVRQAGEAALLDAGLAPADIDAVVVASETDFLSLQVNPGPVVLAELGLVGKPVVRVEGGGASGGLALREAVMQIMAGLYRRVLVVGFDAAAGHLGAADVQLVYGLSFDAETDGMAGATAVALYALSIAEYMARHGATAEQLAHVSVKNHANAIGNPWAHKPMSITVGDVLASPMIATPYRKFDCSMASDGAAAIVLAAPGEAPAADRPRSRITGSGAGSDYPRLGDRRDRSAFRAKARAAHAAYAMAGIDAPSSAFDAAEVYDAFTGAELQSLEALGLAAEGTAGPAMAEGRFDAAGELPVNLSGGLIGQGGVPGATGIAQAVFMDRLLGDRAHGDGARRAIRRGVIDVHGGVCTNAVVHVMERAEP